MSGVGELMAALRRGTRALRGWGWPGALGAAALCVATLGAALWMPAQQRRLDAAEAAVQSLRREAWRAGQAGEAPEQTGVSALPPWQRFLGAFGPADEGRDRVAALWSRAEAAGLMPVRSEFAVEPVAELPLQRLRLALPLTGPYPAVRRFIADALAADALLSLDGLRIERATAQDPVVQVQTQWSFWSRQP